MLVLRCTRKLLNRVGSPVSNPPASTTRLGDWYAKPFPVAQKRFVLLMSAESRLPVVMPGRNVASLAANFPMVLSEVLQSLEFSPEVIEREIRESCDIIIAATKSRSMIGSLNDFALMSQHCLRERPFDDLIELSTWLARTPMAIFGWKYPVEVAQELLG